MIKKTFLRSALILLICPFIMLSANAQTLPTAKQQLVAGGDFNYPPYEWIDEHGQAAGFNTDLMRAIAEVMGWEVTFRLGPWDQVRRDLASNKIDVLPMYKSAERFDVVDFTDPFEMIYYEVFIRRESKPVRSLDEIRGLEVIVQRDALMHDHLKQDNRGARLVLVESEPDALRLLSSGKHDCAIVSRIGGLYAIDRLKLTNLATSGEPLLPRGYALAVKKGNIELRDQLNQGLSIIKKTGKHEDISRKWFGEMEPPRIKLWFVLRYAVWIVVPLLFLAAAAFVWVNMLKKKVAQETRKLSIELEERKKAEDVLRRTEQVLRLFVEHSPAAIAMFDREMKYIVASRRFFVDYDLCDQDIIGRSHYDVFPEMPDRWKEIHRRCLAGAIEKCGEDTFPRTDGSTDWVRWEIHPWCESTGEIGGIILFSEVITERKQIEQELEKHREQLEELVKERTADLEAKTSELERSQTALQYLLEDVNEAKKELEVANERLKELDKLKSMFIASMSHELRTPLNSIIGFTSIILQGMTGKINEEQRDQLQRVSKAGKHLLALITDVIDISKVEAGKVEPYPEEFQLEGVINEACESVKVQIKEKGLELQSIVSDAPVLMHTDRRRFLQCLLNFLSNAIKFTEKGFIRVSACKENGSVRVSVSDTGIGIKPEEMQLLFQSFVRLESRLRRTTPGTGLGLYLTKKIAKKVLGGDIFAESIEGKGSTFSIVIPINLITGKKVSMIK